MGRDSIMRNLALLNQLWDGATCHVDRRTAESFRISGARLTVSIQVQEATLREFFARNGSLTRGSGFLSRFLISWPSSTQGTRFFVDPPEKWAKLEEFSQRIREILSQPAPIESGALKPNLLILSPKAKALWTEYYNDFERELSPGGDLSEIRDVASKAAENVARLAALFQMFERGTYGLGEIEADFIESAARIVAWHLSESKRFFGELALPAELADAARLEKWLLEHCKRQGTTEVNKNYARQFGPLRDKERLDKAISELADLNRLRIRRERKLAILELNPILLE
jgi:putative DNA primase/helicase